MQRAGHGVGGQGPHRDSREGLTEKLGPITGLREAQEGFKQGSYVCGLTWAGGRARGRDEEGQASGSQRVHPGKRQE